MQSRNTRFLIDTNLFIAAIKRGPTRSTELLLTLLEGPWELVADDILISEYERYAKKFEAVAFLKILKSKVVVIEQSQEDILGMQTILSSNCWGGCRSRCNMLSFWCDFDLKRCTF